jgi:mannose-6-phosphate isomerase-like protein (cupin superfamily)
VAAAGGALIRTVLALDAGLLRRVLEFPAGSWLENSAGSGGELWFVIGGTGVAAAGSSLSLRPDVGLWLPPGVHYRVSASSDAGLRCDVVTLPASAAAGQSLPLTRDFADCAVERTGNRQFRVLFGPSAGCDAATQFVGEIPPGRAPEHSHPYDETVLVLAGQGVVHLGGATYRLAPGTCTHLPPGLPHCLENTGSAVLRLLGVFHPADSPAAKLPATPAQPA